jgi:nicotinamide mononucleotide adenylyltransferase
MRGVMVHGRFQPFHNEHLAYVLEGLRRAESFVVVGITNPFPEATPERPFALDAHRHGADANPFSFLERARMVQLSLRDSGAELCHVLVMPLQLDQLDRYRSLASEVVQLVNLIDPWDVEKCRRFADAGFAVETYRRPRTISGTAVRRALEEGASVEQLVPRGTLEVLRAVKSAS